MSDRSSATNLETDSTALFVDADAGDLHLAAGAAEAIDQGATHPDACEDFDGEPRDGAPDLGADEYRAP